MFEGVFFVISAPSGAGKTTIINKLLEDKTLNLVKPLSFTTRKPRKDEEMEKSYNFISKEEFQTLKKNRKLLEWAEVHGNFYGTSLELINTTLKSGKNLIKDIDTQGAMAIAEKLQNKAILIFISPPSLEDLEKRLSNRKTDSKETIKLRLNNAKQEMKYINKYNFHIINDTLDDAVNEIKSIIRNSNK